MGEGCCWRCRMLFDACQQQAQARLCPSTTAYRSGTWPFDRHSTCTVCLAVE